jgi:hypothetical protein
MTPRPGSGTAKTAWLLLRSHAFASIALTLAGVAMLVQPRLAIWRWRLRE